MPGGKYRSKQTRRLEGRRAVNSEIKPTPEKNLEPPNWMRGHARKFWRKNAYTLSERGLLTVLDIPAFELLCWSYGEWRNSIDTVNSKEEMTWAIREEARKNVKWFQKFFFTMCRDFGLMPAAREKVSVYWGDDTRQNGCLVKL